MAMSNPLVFPSLMEKKKQKQILFVGRLEDVKRVDLMLAMWKKLEEKNADWSFVIVGDGSEKANLEKLAKDLNLKNVRFEGYSENPSKYYCQASIFWMTSIYEGWGMTLLESMTCGCIPVAFDTYSSLHDIVQNGENGFIVKEKDEDNFVLRTQTLMDDSHLLDNMRNNALMHIQKFDLEKILDNWEKLLLA